MRQNKRAPIHGLHAIMIERGWMAFKPQLFAEELNCLSETAFFGVTGTCPLTLRRKSKRTQIHMIIFKFTKTNNVGKNMATE
mmetsp:Transcript_33894/g.69199  ORF Transcript_33894/g.69199 Transcript_33894/m.69199 type:complete len:82 (-) Transcript_33894:107-352(-)